MDFWPRIIISGEHCLLWGVPARSWCETIEEPFPFLVFARVNTYFAVFNVTLHYRQTEAESLFCQSLITVRGQCAGKF